MEFQLIRHLPCVWRPLAIQDDGQLAEPAHDSFLLITDEEGGQESGHEPTEKAATGKTRAFHVINTETYYQRSRKKSHDNPWSRIVLFIVSFASQAVLSAIEHSHLTSRNGQFFPSRLLSSINRTVRYPLHVSERTAILFSPDSI